MLWCRLAILGLTDQHLHQRIAQQSYAEQAQKLEILVTHPFSKIMAAAGGKDKSTGTFAQTSI
jgi:hypothetical protein